MSPYFILLLIVCLLLSAYRATRRLFFVHVLVVILILFCGLRDSTVGIDTQNYVGMFNNVDLTEPFFFNPYSFEYGFALLLKSIAYLSSDYWLFLMLAGGLSIFLSAKTLYTLSHNFAISLFLFVTTCTYFFVFNGLRQAIAASIFSIAIVALVRNRKISYLFWVLIAALFHKSVIITIPCFWIVRQQFSLKFIFYLIVSVILFVLAISNLSFFMSINDANRYGQYIERGATGAGLLTIFFIMLPMLYVYLRGFIEKALLLEYDIYLNLSIIVATIYFSVWVMGLDVNFIRLALYFSFGHLLIWPIIFCSDLKGLKPLLFFSLIIVFTLFYFVYLNKMGYLPYLFNSSLA